MYDDKYRTSIAVCELPGPYENLSFAEALRDDADQSSNDRRDMDRMGRKPELKRKYDIVSAFGFTLILGSTWEITLLTAPIAVSICGIAGSIWIYLATSVGMLALMLSLAEMASMLPSSGAQYHWVSEFGPRRISKFLSFLVGWASVLGWQCTMAISAYAAAQQYIELIQLSRPSSTLSPWYGILLTIAVAVFALSFNGVVMRKLPSIEGFIVMLHVAGFCLILTILWVMGPRETEGILHEFEGTHTWSNPGVAALIAIHAPAVALIGSDAACNMSEELKDASWSVPRCMVYSAITSYALGFVMLLTLMFNIGDVAEVLESPAQPYVTIIYQATHSHAATVTVTALVAVLLTACTVNQVSQASRALFAFARDDGLPFSAWFCRIRAKCSNPVHAMFASLVFTCIMSLVNLSWMAQFLIVSLGLSGLAFSYIVTVGVFLWHRFTGASCPPSRFSLGKYGGILANVVALAWLLLSSIFMFFPFAPNPNAAGMNWTSICLCGMVVSAGVYYTAYARHRYTAPVIRSRTQGWD